MEIMERSPRCNQPSFIVVDCVCVIDHHQSNHSRIKHNIAAGDNAAAVDAEAVREDEDVRAHALDRDGRGHVRLERPHAEDDDPRVAWCELSK